MNVKTDLKELDKTVSKKSGYVKKGYTRTEKQKESWAKCAEKRRELYQGKKSEEDSFKKQLVEQMKQLQDKSHLFEEAKELIQNLQKQMSNKASELTPDQLPISPADAIKHVESEKVSKKKISKKSKHGSKKKAPPPESSDSESDSSDDSSSESESESESEEESETEEKYIRKASSKRRKHERPIKKAAKAIVIPQKIQPRKRIITV